MVRTKERQRATASDSEAQRARHDSEVTVQRLVGRTFSARPLVLARGRVRSAYYPIVSPRLEIVSTVITQTCMISRLDGRDGLKARCTACCVS